MTTVETISMNIKRLRRFKKLSQKEVSAAGGIPQGQYSRIENGKVEPSISSLEKLAGVFEVSLGEFFLPDTLDQDINLPLMDKVKMIGSLQEEDRKAILKLIELAIANKRMKDNMRSMIDAR